ncbi:YARHG domain-containing protein [Terrisporobacter sp.]|uniref:YARHG domain-containing protein n=2 Tax=Terrisporobacter TaxID=1505652 RepID=UPI00289DE541|nr:YARHG domain-containing protein [Terrisporobacter sp.]
MSKESCEKIIRGIAVNIASNLANQWKIIKEKQEKTLASKWEGSNFDEDTYIASLKSNLIFYKVSIRNREALLIKWIKSGLIPENEKRHEEFEILLKKCKEYVGRGIKSQGSTFNEVDKKALTHYENIDKNEARMYLEQEYKNFSLYSEVLSLFINNLSKSSLEEFSSIDSKEILKLIKSDILKATNYIKKSMDKVEEKTVLDSMENDSEDSTIKQCNNNVNRAFEPNNSSNKGKKIAIACVTICAVVGLGVTAGLFIGGVLPIDKPKPKQVQETYSPEVEEAEEYNNDLENDQYFIVDSDSRYLTETELSVYTNEELGFIRNEIFARYGYVFKNHKYANYFSEKSWYTPDSTFQGNEEDFNNYEIKNIELIKSLESKDS